MMPSFESFIKGYKSAIYENSLCPQFRRFLPDLLANYPFISGNYIALNGEGETYLFFQNENLKGRFLKQLNGIDKNSLEFHRLLGHTLGYPPKAIDFFIKKELDQSLEKRSVGLYYMGVSCSSDIFDLEDYCRWLWDHYDFDQLLQLIEKWTTLYLA
jgi:hypothetical protein